MDKAQRRKGTKGALGKRGSKKLNARAPVRHASKAKIIIDEERCKGCQLCIEICPKHLITVAESTNSFGYQPARLANDEECTGCALCAQMCPDLAIEVHKEVR